jgi:death-on-curing family protein
MPRAPVGKKIIHHMDLKTLLEVNKQVVTLTGESHQYSAADGRELSKLVKEVEKRADNQGYEDAVAEKAALLVYKVASGQHFHAGNKRTALVAGATFLKKNGKTLDLENEEFVSTVDKVGIAAADLDDLYAKIEDLMGKGKVERKSWDGAVKEVVAKHREFLTRLAS